MGDGPKSRPIYIDYERPAFQAELPGKAPSAAIQQLWPSVGVPALAGISAEFRLKAGLQHRPKIPICLIHHSAETQTGGTTNEWGFRELPSRTLTDPQGGKQLGRIQHSMLIGAEGRIIPRSVLESPAQPRRQEWPRYRASAKRSGFPPRSWQRRHRSRQPRRPRKGAKAPAPAAWDGRNLWPRLDGGRNHRHRISGRRSCRDRRAVGHWGGWGSAAPAVAVRGSVAETALAAGAVLAVSAAEVVSGAVAEVTATAGAALVVSAAAAAVARVAAELAVAAEAALAVSGAEVVCEMESPYCAFIVAKSPMSMLPSPLGLAEAE